MASNHLSTHYDMTDFHEQQLNHYRKKGTADLQQRRAERQAAKNDKALPPAPSSNTRRPVPLPTPSPSPARRPVPPPRRTEASLAESHGYSYQTRPSDHESAGLEMATKHLGELKIHNNGPSSPARSSTSTSRQRTYTPAPPSPRGRPQTPDRVRRIVRDSSGRFDERNVVEDYVHRYPSLDPRRPVTPPHLIEASTSYSGLDPKRPMTPLSERDRPGSSSSSSRPGSASSFLSKTFSWGSRPGTPTGTQGKSPSSSRPRKPRRGSFKDAVARVSTEFSRGKDIVTLNAHDRERWMADERARINRETEQRRRERPETRPKYQRDFIAASRYSKDSRIVPPPAPYSSSTSAISLPSPVREAALDWTTQHKNYDYDADEDRRARPVPFKAAVTLSKITDWVKPKRKDSAGSEMSFADCAPEGVLEECSRCGQAVSGKGFLTRGLCRGCYQRRLNEIWEDSSPAPDESSSYSGDSTRSSSPTIPREVNEEEYMYEKSQYRKIATSRRIRRIRRTIYSDPGNPFAFGFDAAPTTLFHRSRDVSPNPKRIHSGQPRLELNDSPASMIEGSQGVLSDSPLTPPPEVRNKEDRLRDSLLCAPRPRRSGTPALIRRDGIAAAIALSEAGDERDGEDEKLLAPKTIFRKRSLSWGGLESPKPMEGLGPPVSPGGNVRNTMYYGFYDQVLQEYHRSQERLLGGAERQDYI